MKKNFSLADKKAMVSLAIEQLNVGKRLDQIAGDLGVDDKWLRDCIRRYDKPFWEKNLQTRNVVERKCRSFSERIWVTQRARELMLENDNISETAEILGVNPKTLASWLRGNVDGQEVSRVNPYSQDTELPKIDALIEKISALEAKLEQVTTEGAHKNHKEEVTVVSLRKKIDNIINGTLKMVSSEVSRLTGGNKKLADLTVDQRFALMGYLEEIHTRIVKTDIAAA